MTTDKAMIEAALDSGRLKARMEKGAWWQVRRNGRTQTWKTRPGAWRIPIKVGFKTCGELTDATPVATAAGEDANFMITVPES